MALGPKLDLCRGLLWLDRQDNPSQVFNAAVDQLQTTIGQGTARNPKAISHEGNTGLLSLYDS